MEDAFTTDEIKKAFYETFKGAGEQFFPYAEMGASETEITAAVEDEWANFLANLLSGR